LTLIYYFPLCLNLMGTLGKIISELEECMDVYIPDFLVYELENKISLIARCRGVSENEVRLLVRLLTLNMKLISLDKYREFLPLAGRLTRDPKDVVFVALALYVRGLMYDTVILFTNNVRDYVVDELKNYGVIVTDIKNIYSVLYQYCGG